MSNYDSVQYPDKTARFLSVDWDYFFNCPEAYKMRHFPDTPNENYPEVIQDVIWSSHYNPVSELDEVKVKFAEIYTLAHLLKDIGNSLGEHSLSVTESHSFSYTFFTSLIGEVYDEVDKIEVINIDAHSDLSRYREIKGGKTPALDCGNWLSFLCRDVDKLTLHWVNPEGVETGFPKGFVVPGGMFYRIETCIGQMFLKSGISDYGAFLRSFRGIHICRSDMWSPPHGDSEFLALVKPARQQFGKSDRNYYEPKVFKSRWGRIVDLIKEFETARRNLI